MNKVRKIFTIILIFISFYILFSNSYLINKSVMDATNLWFTKVFPSLFIMFILNDLIINSHILDGLNNLISPLFNKIFNTSGGSSLCFILTIFSGTPSSGFIIKEMLNNKEITLNDANKLIAFTYFANPLFLYNILRLSFNQFITIKIILIHYFSNLLIGLMFRGTKVASKRQITESSLSANNFWTLIPKAITKSFNTLLMILGTIIFYMIITNLFLNMVPLKGLGEVLFKGLLEITQALNTIPSLNNISLLKELLALIIISFGGLSIHTQILSLIIDQNISYKNFLKGRILHVLFSTITYLFISCIIIG